MSDHDVNDSDELDPDEPRTPWWMPLLGGFLFLVAALLAIASSADTDAAEGIAPESPGAEAEAEGAPSPGRRDPHAGHGHDHDHPGQGHD